MIDVETRLGHLYDDEPMIDVVNDVLETIELEPCIRYLHRADVEFTGLPRDSRLVEMHTNLVSDHLHELQPLSPIARGRQVGRLLLADWITLGKLLADGQLESIAGFHGISPLAQPAALQALGARVRPSQLNSEGKELINTGHDKMTGQYNPDRSVRIHQFFITKSALVQGLPHAQRLLDRLG